MGLLKTREAKIIFVFAAIAFAVFGTHAIQESDTFYHLKTGELIWQTGHVPAQDVFSYLAAGRPWVTHEWLAELIFYGIQKIFNLWGVVIFTGLIAAASFGLIAYEAIRRGAHSLLAPLIIFLLAYPTFLTWDARPQIFGFVCLAGLLVLLNRYRESGRASLLITGVVLMWIWANTHASFLLGFAVIGWYALYELGLGRSDRVSRFRGKQIMLMGIGAAAAALLNPNSYRIFLYGISIRSAVEIFHVEEWSPLLANLNYPFIALFLVEMLTLNILIAWQFWKKEFLWIGLVWGVSILPFLSVRHMGFWPLAAGIPAAVALARFFEAWLGRYSFSKIFHAASVVFLALLLVRYFTFPREAVDSAVIPVYAADFIENNHIPGPRFNLYNEGGYLIWRFWPQDQVSIDGRSEVYAGEPADAFLKIATGQPGWTELADRYQINQFLLAYEPDSLGRSVFPLVQDLMRRNWILVYWDDTAVLFVRPVERNRAIIEKYGMRHVSPFRSPDDIGPDERQSALVELSQVLQLSPRTELAKAYALKVLAAAKKK